MTPAKVSSGEMVVLDDAAAMAEAVAAWLLDRRSHRTGSCSVCRAGRRRSRLYEKLASPAYLQRFPWAKTHLFWGDERFVPADHPESNYRMTKLAMLDKAPIPAEISTAS